MNTMMHNNDDERFLEPFIASARESADDAAIADAANRLRARLPEAKENRAIGWQPRFAAAAVAITGLALTLNLFVPGGGGTAFAAVQQWFSNYQTIDVRTTLAIGDEPMVETRVRGTAAGDTRIENAGVVMILNASEQTFITLLPDQRFFQKPIEGFQSPDENLQWMEKLRDFQGEATQLSDTRLIEGRTATGHQLIIDEISLLLWSDVTSNQPILMEGELPGGLRLEIRFDFNVALEPGLFDLPVGYKQVKSE